MGVETFENTLIETSLVDGGTLGDIVFLGGRVPFENCLERSDTGTDRH